MNHIYLSGVIASDPIHSHTTRTTLYSTFKMSVKRLSGVEDLLDVIIPSILLDESGLRKGEFASIDGQIRSYNNKNAETNKLKINAWAQSLKPCEEIYDNRVELIGSVCKTPIYRQTPYGREISDLMLSIPRQIYGDKNVQRYDYLPCISWGSIARMCAELEPRTKLHLVGRFQSRQYIKIIDGIPHDRTAYEISVSYAETAENIEDTAYATNTGTFGLQ